jgi:hypothetical protein
MQTLKIPKNSILTNYETMKIRRDFDNTYCSTGEYLAKHALVYNQDSLQTYKIGSTAVTRSLFRNRNESPVEDLKDHEPVPDPIKVVYKYEEKVVEEEPVPEPEPEVDATTRYYQKCAEFYHAVKRDNMEPGTGIYNGAPLITRRNL